MRAISVAVSVPGLGPLTYAVPDGIPDPAVGARVLVPLGHRTVTGICLGSDPGRSVTKCVNDPPGSDPSHPVAELESGEPGSDPDVVAPRPVVDVLDDTPFLPPDVIELAAWVADYYACGIGEAIATAVPPRAWIETERHARITELGEGRLLIERGLRRDVLEKLAGGRVASVEALA